MITLTLRAPVMQMFGDETRAMRRAKGNQLVIDFDDPGWITPRFLAKQPGPGMHLGEAEMTFRYGDSFRREHGLEGYERLLLLAMLGDQSLFTRADGIERVWEISAPLLDDPPPVELYSPGSWGPDSADRLIAPYRWYLPDGKEPDGSPSKVSSAEAQPVEGQPGSGRQAAVPRSSHRGQFGQPKPDAYVCPCDCDGPWWPGGRPDAR